MSARTKTPRERAAPTVVELVDGYADLDDDERLRIDIEIGELRRLLSLIPEGERIEGQVSEPFVSDEGYRCRQWIEDAPTDDQMRPAVLYVQGEETT